MILVNAYRCRYIRLKIVYKKTGWCGVLRSRNYKEFLMWIEHNLLGRDNNHMSRSLVRNPIVG
jgi:hypothetical protein